MRRSPKRRPTIWDSLVVLAVAALAAASAWTFWRGGETAAETAPSDAEVTEASADSGETEDDHA